MSMPEACPWRELYPAAVPAEMTVGHDSLTAAWRARVARDPDAVALRYFDGALTARETDAASDALACAFAARGTRRGDRVGVYLMKETRGIELKNA